MVFGLFERKENVYDGPRFGASCKPPSPTRNPIFSVAEQENIRAAAAAAGACSPSARVSKCSRRRLALL